MAACFRLIIILLLLLVETFVIWIIPVTYSHDGDPLEYWYEKLAES